ncbi:hypothetical protein SAMN04487928_10190 [Butyrivibrio proteoclasticus]|uniref:Uncharacterized protein n=1 Tax=Butyrivibrio proteoclasticus TaxID=43305 RepID=A0A1I5PQS1_9FIRM|nr:hypothetical protein [Butyrivibrio proteoclasticus]SFP35936.1 hypothetical protein SAMN04487928_10190 [Butyrivibrio proteoclasticus]
MLRAKRLKMVKKIFVMLLIYSSLSMYLNDFFKKIFDMEEFVWTEAIKLIFPYSFIATIVFFMIGLYVNRSIDELSNEMWQKTFALIFSFVFLAGLNISTVGKFAENMHSMRMILFDLVFLMGMYYISRFILMHIMKNVCLLENWNKNWGGTYVLKRNSFIW